MVRPVPQFEEVHIISDLHLGGEAGFQIFNAGTELARFVDSLRVAQSQTLGLVVNGDFVDFLAEAPQRHFDPDGAAAKLEGVASNPSFLPVFDALRRFIQTAGRVLVINLGNHDLELALPWVREKLLELLAGPDSAARGRILFCLDGTGFRCSVGHASILCVHGNEVDPWNVADYEAIRRIARDLLRGGSVEPWIPNAGSRLVIEVMNDLKRTYPFVDLLKPEKEAVVPILGALKPDVGGRLDNIAAAMFQKTWDRIRLATGFLGGGDEGASVPSGIPRGTSGGTSPGAPVARSRMHGQTGYDEYVAKLLDRVEMHLVEGERPIDLITADQQTEYLGFFGAGWNLLKGDREEALRQALEQLDKDRSFDVRDKDETFRQLDQLVGRDVDFLVAGHTHLARAINRERGNGFYFNSGTWARVFRLKAGVRDDPVAFKNLFVTLQSPNVQALDAADGLERQPPTLVAIWRDGSTVKGELRQYPLGTTGGPTPVANSLFVKG